MDKIASIRQLYIGTPDLFSVSIWHNNSLYSANCTNIELIRIYQTNPVTYQETVNRKNAKNALIKIVKSKNNLK
jgi:hypothetical protein